METFFAVVSTKQDLNEDRKKTFKILSKSLILLQSWQIPLKVCGNIDDLDMELRQSRWQRHAKWKCSLNAELNQNYDHL